MTLLYYFKSRPFDEGLWTPQTDEYELDWDGGELKKVKKKAISRRKEEEELILLHLLEFGELDD